MFEFKVGDKVYEKCRSGLGNGESIITGIVQRGFTDMGEPHFVYVVGGTREYDVTTRWATTEPYGYYIHKL